MFLSEVLLLSFAALALADPIPQAAATTSLGSFPTDAGSSPSEAAAESAELASLSSLESLESGMPTLASFAESVLLTAVPTSVDTDQLCQTTTPGWYKSLPADVKSALSSYDSAFASWYSVHSTDFNVNVSVTATLPGNFCSGTVFISTTGATNAPASTGHVTATGGATATTGSGSATGSGTAASVAPSSSSSKAAAPHPTGAVGLSFAWAVGVLGLMVAL